MLRGSAYSWWDKTLHWLALEPLFSRELAFDLEMAFFLPAKSRALSQKTADASGGSVYVCGLARSGTTVLLRALDSLADFRSLSYRDMPFVLCPNVWRVLHGMSKRSMASVERVHGDGIFVDYDSPEAFEEVFWRTFTSGAYSGESLDNLEEMEAALQKFRNYREIVARPRGVAPRRYLSKNNNNLVRFDRLASEGSSRVLLVYRDPFSTARSSLRQHLKFCQLQENDAFMQKYMKWLGHCEFGLQHEPLYCAKGKLNAAWLPENLSYWLDYWDVVYRDALLRLSQNVYLVNYEKLCSDPEQTMRRILEAINVHADPKLVSNSIEKRTEIRQTEGAVDSRVKARVKETYARLLDCQNNVA